MGCSNSTAKSADDRKNASQAKKGTQAQKPKPKTSAPADDATHLTVATASPASPPADPLPAKTEAEKKAAEEAKPAAAAAEEDNKAEDEVKQAAEEDVVVNLAAEPAVPAAVAEAVAAEEKAEKPAAAAAVAAADAPQVATAPEEEEDVAADDGRRRSSAAPLHQESQTQQVADPNSPYAGPGPEEAFPIDNIYRCFEEDNGLLFRLVSKKRHMWAFYNDTVEYVMHVSVTFGPESSVEPLGDTQAAAVNEETGECTLVLDVPPGETKQFMKGEYNGFTTCYDANPIDDFAGELEASHDEPIAQSLEFTNTSATKPDGAATVPLEDASDGGTRIHFMEADPNKAEPEDDLKKRREEA